MPPNQINQVPKQRSLKKWIMFAVLLLLGLLVLRWFFNQAYIEVIVDSNSSSEVTYQFKNQENQKITEVKDAAKRIKKLLPKGSYEVTVRQDKANYFSVTKTGGTRSTTTIKATPQGQRGRSFIGNQPLPCMHVVEEILFSYECQDSLSILQTHEPATAGLPTLTNPTFSGGEDLIEGFVSTRAGEDIMLVSEVEVAGHDELAAETEHSPHSIFVVRKKPGNADLEIVSNKPLPGLSEEEMYSIAPYRDGFVAFNESASQILYFSSLDAQSTKLPVANISKEGLTPFAVTVHGDEYAVTYTGGGQNKIIVYRDGSEKRISLDKSFNSIRLCGEQRMCGIDEEGWLEVYDLTSEKAELLYRVSDVTTIENISGSSNLVVVRADEVLSLNVEKRAGDIQYSFGDYNFCGLQPSGDSYLLCVVNSNSAESVLAINQQEVSDDIDQKISDLLSLSDIDTISIYRNYIYIAPDVGKEAFSVEADGYVHNPETVKRVNAKIREKIKELNIDQNKYKINNFLED